MDKRSVPAQLSEIPFLDVVFAGLLCIALLLLALAPAGSLLQPCGFARRALIITLAEPYTPWHYELASARNATLANIALNGKPYTCIVLEAPLPPPYGPHEERCARVTLKPVQEMEGYYSALRVALNNAALQELLVKIKKELNITRYYLPLLSSGVRLQRGYVCINIYGVSANGSLYLIAVHESPKLEVESIIVYSMSSNFWRVICREVLQSSTWWPPQQGISQATSIRVSVG